MTEPTDFWYNLFSTLISSGIVGIALWLIGYGAEKRKIKIDAIRDLMAFRGDFENVDFRRALNRISITFHDDDEIRTDVRGLYEIMSSGRYTEEKTKRAIVGLIYKLCKNNGITKLTEYDIDQSFAEGKQTPDARQDDREPIAIPRVLPVAVPATPPVIAPVAPIITASANTHSGA